MINSFENKTHKETFNMKKILYILLFVLNAFLYGQAKKEVANYGYHLMPLKVLSESDRQLMSGHQFKSVDKLAKVTDLPVSVDNSSLMPPVLDQGQQGSCVAFAVCYALAYLNNKRNGWSLDHQYSQSFLYNLPGSTETGGTDAGIVCSVMQEAGYVTSQLFPYDPTTSATLPSLPIMQEGIKNRIFDDWYWFYIGDTLPPVGYGSYPVPIPGYLGINTTRALLAAGKPVVLELSLTAGYGGAMANENWVYSYATSGQQEFTGSHDLYIVGYNDTIMTKDGRGAFKVINSWGADKFEHGYCWITYKFLAMKDYGWYDFATFSLRDNYQPQLTVTFDLRDFGCFAWMLNSGLKVGNNVYKQRLWAYRWGRLDQNFLKEVIIDLTDISNGLLISGQNTFFIEGTLFASMLGPNKPTITGIHITDPIRGIDAYQASNIVIKDSIFHVEWNFTNSAITGINRIADSSPLDYVLNQNYPNPFNPVTTINYSLAKEGNVKLTVYNTIGSKVATIVNEYKSAGNYSVQFNGSNFASGIYLYRMESGSFSTAKKLILLK